VIASASFSVDTEGLTRLSRDFLAAAWDFKAQSPATLAEIGTGLQERARSIAAEHSQSIPPSIHGRLEGRLTYVVEAGGENAPLAGIYELGNRGSSRDSPTFRHPFLETATCG
jgi:hypothetical protein